MKTFSLLSALVFFLGSSSALDKIVIKGSKFFNSKTGDEFFIKGIAYQPEKGDPNPQKQDPLADAVGCKRDAPVIKDLGVNTIRVYQTDYANNHDACMKEFENNGIYVMLDLGTSSVAINRDDPYWDTGLFAAYRAKVDAFAGYSNVVGFIAGNEVANSNSKTPSAAFVKAAIRDVKAYIAKNKLDYPVGYASNDEPDIRDNLKAYFNCGDDAGARADFYGVNLYSWCSNRMTFQTSGYSNVVAEYKNYSIPVLLTEYGCIAERPRLFNEVKSLYGPDMQDTFSGGFMYMYTEEENNYGIVEVSYGNSDLNKLDEFLNFKQALTGVSPSGVKMSSYNPSGTPEQCPSTSDTWKVDPSALPPTPSTEVCTCMYDSLSCIIKNDTVISSKGDSDTLLSDSCTGNVDCSPIMYDTAKGVYGSFVFCDNSYRLSYALNGYYSSNGKSEAACSSSSSGIPASVVDSPKNSDISSCTKNKKDDIGSASNVSSSSSTLYPSYSTFTGTP
ncbi:hypothetical protein BB560_002231, partial [Smittium megazygosporum]